MGEFPLILGMRGDGGSVRGRSYRCLQGDGVLLFKINIVFLIIKQVI